MKFKLRILIAVVAALALWPPVASAQKLVILVRHAERADGGPVAGMASTTDPLLSAAGEARAQKLASMLADSGIKAIFVTEFKRTQDTGKPLATKLGLTPAVVKAADTAALVTEIKSKHAQDVVLIVGHSNTLPDVIKAFGGPDVTIADAEYDNLFVLSPGTAGLTRIRF